YIRTKIINQKIKGVIINMFKKTYKNSYLGLTIFCLFIISIIYLFNLPNILYTIIIIGFIINVIVIMLKNKNKYPNLIDYLFLYKLTNIYFINFIITLIRTSLYISIFNFYTKKLFLAIKA